MRRDSGKAPGLPPRPSHLASSKVGTNSSSSSSSSNNNNNNNNNNTSNSTEIGGGSIAGGDGEERDESAYLEYRESVALGEQFSLESLDLFDELMNRGFTVDFKTKNVDGEVVADGTRVNLALKAMTWDGAATVVHKFEEGSLAFNVDQSTSVPEGLVQAVKCMTEGSRAVITCTPHMAYGEAGNPPFVKPHSHIVFDVTVIKVEPASATLPPVQGPMSVVKSSTIVPEPMHKIIARRGSARIASVVFDASPISDELLLQQAVASGLSLSTSNP